MNYNRVILLGRVTKDPELKYTPKGTPIAKLGLAINREWKSESGEKKSEATFVDIDCFGKAAEVLAQHLKKGRAILVDGRLKTDVWDDKQTGQKRSKLGVVLESFQFMDSRQESGGARTTAPSTEPPPNPEDPSDPPF